MYRLVLDSRVVKMEGNVGDEEGMFLDIRKDYSCFWDLNLYGCKGMGVYLWIIEIFKNW